MLKRNITYTDFNGEEVTETLYFNLSFPELVELEVEEDDGFERVIQQIIASGSRKELVRIFKKLILDAYGEKSKDGKTFVKNEEIREKFYQSAAYTALFTELATDDEAAVDFMVGILPADMQAQARNEANAQKN